MKIKQQQPTIALDSLGCKLNQAEMGILFRQLSDWGCRLVSPSQAADLYILNTCTITHIADRKTRQKLRGYRRLNPNARVVAVGCYAERAPDELKKLEGVDLVIGNDEKVRIPRILENSGYLQQGMETPYSHLHEESRRTRAFLKVQEGCRNFCAYCIVPHVRHRPASVPVKSILEEIKQRVAEGFKEIVITGTEIGQYYSDGIDLSGLIERILAEAGVARLRLSSLQPSEVTSGLINLWHDPRLCPHFHLSLQSGSDSVLDRMNRRYCTGDYRQTVNLIREVVPDAAVTTDVIVGFPGESDDEFRETLDFCREMQFARIHVFPYSSRPGTAAAGMPGTVSATIKKERGQRMLALAKASSQSFIERFIGRTTEVLFEQESGGLWSGLTGNYIRVYLKNGSDLTNQILPVALSKPYKGGISEELEV
ncbi:MAG TPA: tRNA (N(6)-L-threonylcarbamoyladenosine(37)-C(2))-methylthiotransferase MtaB [Dehalococcoidia bacterium]|nr:tRNA (N(6)-L-threonylcarbamoyladenosine(37)-C(2))-methylthiotransferase MtaB [Dehalococcoidia bacterium]